MDYLVFLIIEAPILAPNPPAPAEALRTPLQDKTEPQGFEPQSSDLTPQPHRAEFSAEGAGELCDYHNNGAGS